MKKRRYFLHCMMIIGALQSNIFCSQSKYAPDKEDVEVSQFFDASDHPIQNFSEWDDSPDITQKCKDSLKKRINNIRKKILITTDDKKTSSCSKVTFSNDLKLSTFSSGGNRRRAFAFDASNDFKADEESKDED